MIKIPELRQYQTHIRELYKKDLLASDNKLNAVIQLPTGTGKGTIIVADIIENFERRRATLVVVPSDELVYNICDRVLSIAPQLKPFIVPITGKTKKVFDTGITVGVYKSIYSAIKKGLISPYQYSLIIHDEFHHSKSNTWNYIIDYLKGNHLGYTATPTRLDGRPFDSHFQKLYVSPPLDWFIENKYLSKYVLFSKGNIDLDSLSKMNDDLSGQNKKLNNNEQVGNAIEQWEKYSLGKKSFIYCVSKDHSDRTAHLFNEKFDGLSTENGTPYKFVSLTSNTPERERKKILKDFDNNKILGITNINILTEGVDVQDAETCLLLRFTWSTSLWLQMAGRVLRYVPNKTAIILDLIGNALYHGSPSYEYEWTLQGSVTQDNQYKCLCAYCEIPLVSRSKVARHDGPYEIRCSNCGYENVFEIEIMKKSVRRTAPDEIEGELIEFTANGETMKIYNILRKKIRSQHKLEKIIELEVDEDLKRKALTCLGYSDSVIELYLRS